jgi:hypothetical protein
MSGPVMRDGGAAHARHMAWMAGICFVGFMVIFFGLGFVVGRMT